MNTAVINLLMAIKASIFGFAIGTTNLAEANYIPISDNQGVFNVVYHNAAASRFTLQILDEAGDQLFQHTYTDKDFSRRFQLAEPDSYTKLIFVIRNLSDHSSQRFEVETSTHLIEDVNVKALN